MGKCRRYPPVLNGKTDKFASLLGEEPTDPETSDLYWDFPVTPGHEHCGEYEDGH